MVTITFKCRSCGLCVPMPAEVGENGTPIAPASSPPAWIVHSYWMQESDTGLMRAVTFASCSTLCFQKLLEQPLSVGDLWQTTPTAQA